MGRDRRLCKIDGILGLSGKIDGIHEKGIVPMDGKESRSFKRKAAGQGEVKVLRLIDLRDTIVTADAMNCQKETVAAIVFQKGDYVLALRGFS